MAARKPGRLRVTAAAGTAWLLFVAGLALAAGPALAQGNDALVSNARQTLTGTGSSFELAQSFTTGPNAGGYSISKIRIRLLASEPPDSSDGSFVTIKTDVAGSPGTIVATLNNPASFRRSALNGFTAPAGTTLEPDTTYWIVINEGSTSGLTVANTNSDGEDSRSLEGPGAWMIGDGSKWRRQGTTEWNDSSASRVIKVRGKKAALATPDVTEEEKAELPTEKKNGKAAAQELVSNLGRTDSATVATMQAQAFTAGGNLHDYRLTSVEIQLGVDQANARGMRVQVVPSDDDVPNDSDSSKIVTLTNPASFTAGAANTFTAPAVALLDAKTEYFVVVSGAYGAGDPQYTLAQTATTDEDSDPATGWSIGDARLSRSSALDSWESVTGRVLKIRVNGEILEGTGDPVVTIAAVESSIIAGVDTASFMLTRTGSTTDELVVNVEIEQNRPYLSASNLTQEVTILVGSVTATLEISASSFQRLPEGTVVTHGALTVRAVDGDDYDVVSASSVDVDVFPRLTLGFEFDTYVLGEGISVVTGHLVALTGEGAAKPSTALSFPVSTLPIGEAEPPDDFAPLSELIRIGPGDYVMYGSRYRAALPFEIEIVDDIDDEDDERFGLVLSMDVFFQFLGLGGYLITATGENCGNQCGCVDDECDYELAIAGHLERDMPRVLVTNTPETSTTGSSNNIHAQSFVTGPLLVGYRVSEVGLYLRSSAALSTSSTTFAAIKTDDSGSPGTTVADLTNPAGFTDDAINFFTAPEDTILAPSTTYWLVVNDEISTASDRAGVVTTDSNADESLEDPAWAIGDVRFTRAATADSWTEDADALKMEIVGKGAWIELTAEATINTTSLSWVVPLGSALGALGYHIEVSQSDGATWWDLEADTESTGTTYTHDASLLAGETRLYRASAITGRGTSPPSNEAVASATIIAPGLVARGFPPGTVPRSRALIDICWTPDGVALGDLRDITWAKWGLRPAAAAKWDRYWRPHSSKPRYPPDCPAGAVGYREWSRAIPNLTYEFTMKARRGNMWVMSNDAEAVSTDVELELNAYVTAANSDFSVDTPVPAIVCRDFDDPVTADNEAGSFTVTVAFSTIDPGLGIYLPVTGFDVDDDLELTNATATLLDRPYHYLLGYRVLITPTVFDQPVGVKVPAGAVTQADSGAANAASESFTRQTSASDCHPRGEGLPVPWPLSVWHQEIEDDKDNSGSWTHGEQVRVTLTFLEELVVTTDGGRPTVTLTLDGTTVEAPYAEGSGSEYVVFEYVVTADQSPVNEIVLLADSLALNGGRITTVNGDVEAVLAHRSARKQIRPPRN